MKEGVIVDIILATYNGEKFVAQQLDSIIAQSYPHWVLFIRDDGSKDNTVSIVKEYCQKYPQKIILIEDGLGNIGVKSNFSRLARYSKNDYLMLSDQDDVWMQDKVEFEVQEIQKAEKEFPGLPILIHTDLTIVDENLKEISASFWKHQKLDIGVTDNVSKTILNNVTTGCTMILNKKAVEAAFPIPVQAIMHDWWISIIVSKYGKVIPINRSTIFYRQHGKNTVGAARINWKFFLNKLLSPLSFLRRYNRMTGILPFKISLIASYFWKLFYTLRRIFIV